MGDRSNVVVDFGRKGPAKTSRVYIYSHWAGTRVALNLRDACKAGVRTTDDSYFARILFDRIIGKSQGEEIGHGLSPFITDNEHDVLVVNCNIGKVWAETPEGEPIPGREWTIKEFGELDDKAARAAMGE